MKILLNGTLGSIYLLRAESLFFVEFILKIEDFFLIRSLEVNSRTQSL